MKFYTQKESRFNNEKRSTEITFPLSTVISAHTKCNKSINSIARTVLSDYGQLLQMSAPYMT